MAKEDLLRRLQLTNDEQLQSSNPVDNESTSGITGLRGLGQVEATQSPTMSLNNIVSPINNAAASQPSEYGIGNLFSPEMYGTSSYDDDMLWGYETKDIPLSRYAKQSNMMKAVNSIVGGVASGLGTAVEDLAYIFDIPEHIKAFTGEEGVEGNVFSNGAKQYKEWVESALPIYENPREPNGFWDSFFRWSTLKSGIDSAVGFAIPGSVVSKAVGMGAKGLRGARLATYLEKLGASTGSNVLKNIGFGINKAGQFINYGRPATYINSTLSGILTNDAEGKMMAIEMKENTDREFISKRAKELLDSKYNGDSNYTQQAIQEASEELNNNAEYQKWIADEQDSFVNRNRLMLASDIFALHGIFKGKGFTRNTLKDPSLNLFKNSIRQISADNPLLQMAREGGEEIFQNILQSEGEYQVNKKTGVLTNEEAKRLEEKGIFGRALEFGLSTQALVEGAMGFITGGIQRHITQGAYDVISGDNIKGTKRKAERFAEYERQQQEIASYTTSTIKDIMVGESIKQQALQNNDEVTYDEVADLQFGKKLATSFGMGTAEQLERAINDIANMSEEDALANGFDKNYKEEAIRRLEQLNKSEKDWLKYDGFLNREEIFYNRYVDKNFVDWREKLQSKLEQTNTELNRKYPNFDTRDADDVARILSTPEGIELTETRNQIDNLTKAIEYNDQRFKVITSEKYQDIIRDSIKTANEEAEKVAKDEAVAQKEAVKNEVKEALSTADNEIKEEVINNFTSSAEGNPIAQEAVSEAVRESADNDEVNTVIDEIDSPLTYSDINTIVSGINNEAGEYIPVSVKEVMDKSAESGTGEVDMAAMRRRIDKDAVLQSVGLNSDMDNTVTIDDIDTWIKANKGNRAFANPTAKAVINRLEDFVTRTRKSIEDIENAVTSPQVLPSTNTKKGDISNEGDVAQTRKTIEAIYETSSDIESTIAQSNIDPNEPIEEVSGKQGSTKLTYGRSKNAYSSVAYLSMNYKTYYDPISNSVKRIDAGESLIDSEIVRNALNPELVKIGKGVTFEVQDDPNLEIYSNGNKVLWGSLKAQLNNDEIANRVPILIKVDDRPIGYIHDTEWVSEDTVYSNVEEEKENLSKFRKDIISGAITKGTISRRSDGYLATTQDREPIPFNEAISNPAIKLMVKKGDKFIGAPKTLDTAIKSPEGYTYMSIPISENRHIPVPILRSALSSVQINTISKAIELFVKHKVSGLNKDESTILNSIVNNMGSILDQDQNPIEFNISTSDGLRNFVSLFTYLTPATNMSIVNTLNSKPSDYSALSIEENNNTIAISFGRGKNIGVQTLKIEKQGQNAGKVNAPLDFFDKLKEHLNGMYFYSNAKLLEVNNELPIPSIGEDNTIIFTNTKYEDYLKQNVRTMFREFNIGTEDNPQYIYTIQPKIEFHTAAMEAEPISTPKGEKVTLSKFGEVDISNTAFSDEFYSIDSLTLEDFESFAQAQEGVNLITADVQKVPIGQQHQLIDFIAKDLTNQAITSEILSSKQISSTLDDFKSNIEQLRDIYSEKGNTKVREHFDEILNKWNNVKQLVFNKLSATSGLTARLNEESDNIVDFVGEESSYERTRFSDSYTLEVDSKHTVSSKMKQFFASIDNPLRTFYINGQPITESFDTVYNTVQAILANTKPSFNMMVQRLKEVEHIAWMPNLIDKLLNASQQIKNEFVVAMNKHYVNMFFAMYSDIDGRPLTEVYNTNANSIERTVSESWYNNLIISPLVTTKDGNYYYSPEIVDEIKKEYQELKSQKAPNIDTLNSWLKKMGIMLSPNTLSELVKGEFVYNNKQYTYEALFGNEASLFGNLVSKLNTEGQITDSGNQLFSDSIVKGLIKFEAQNSLRVFSNSHRSGTKTVYSYTNDKYVMDRFFDLKNGNKLAELSSLPFNKESSWLKQMVKDGVIDRDSKAFNVFDVNYLALDAFKVKGTNAQDDNDLAHLAPVEHEVTKLTMFFNNNSISKGTGGQRVGRFFYPTMSDKTASFVITAPLYNVSLGLDGNVTDNVVNYVYNNIVQSEINRMLSWREETNDGSNPVNIDAYNEGATKFLFFPQLNTIEELFDTDENGNKLLRKNILVNGDLQSLIKENLADILNSIVTEQVEDWLAMGIGIPSENNQNELSLIDARYVAQIERRIPSRKEGAIQRAMAADYAINYVIANANIYQLFIGDPALYYKSKSQDPVQQAKDTFINIGKRLAGDNAPGMEADFTGISTTYNLAVVRDTKLPSVAIEYYNKLGLADEYKKITGSDAQEFTTADEHIDVMYAFGKLDEASYRDIKDKIKKGEPLSKKQLNLVMQPIKPVYVANQIVGDIAKGYGIDVRRYVKSSSFPLIPQLTAGLEIDKVREAMEKKGIQRLAFESAVKIGAPRVRESIIDKNGNMSITALNNTVPVTLSREGFKIQQEVPYHEDDDTINRGTQEAKLLFANIKHINGFKYKDKEYSGEELEKVYTDTYKDIFEEKYNQLIDELEYTETRDQDGNIIGTTLNMQKLENILKEEAIGRGYPINDIMGLSLGKDNNFKFPLWSLPSAQNYESLLLSIVDNRVRKIKLPGTSFVLGTQEGFKVIRDVEEAGVKLQNLKNDIVFTSSWTGELLPQRLSDDGSKVLPSQVLVPCKIRDENGKIIDIKKYAKRNSEGNLILNEDVLPKNLLKIFGFRIPTQGHSSMMGIEIVGFLPDTVGDLCIASRDLTIQMGSDFDVDKLYTYNYSLLPVKTSKGIVFKKIDDLSEDEERYFIDRTPNTSAVVDDALSKLLGIDITDTNPLKLRKLYNNLLDLHLSVMENPNPELQASIASPIGFGDLKSDSKNPDNNLASTINKWREDRLSKGTTFNGLSAKYQRTKFINATAGKAGVAVFSSAMVFLASTQGKNIYYAIKSNEDSGGKNLFKVTFGDTSSYGDLSGSKTINGKKLRTKVMEAFQSAAVDNEKEQILDKLNINSYTFNVINPLVMMGFTEKDITSLISQDVIFDYVNRLITSESQLAPYIENSKERIRSQIKDELYDRVAEFHPEISRDEFDKIVDKKKTLSADQAMEYIKYGEQLDDYYIVQAAMLDKFDYIEQAGKDILAVQSAINTDSKGLGKSFIGSVAKEEKIKSLDEVTRTPYNISGVFNAEKLLGNFVRNEDNNSFIAIESPTLLGMSVNYALFPANKIFSKFFPYNSITFTSAVDNISKAIRPGVSESISIREKLATGIFKDLKAYLYTNPELLGVTNSNAERKRLLIDESEDGRITNMSLASIIKKVQDTPYGKRNNFINRLNTIINKNGNISRVTYNAAAGANLDESMIYQGFSDMVSTDTSIDIGDNRVVSSRTIAKDLIKYAYLTGGIRESKEYIKFIPIEILNRAGFGDILKAINFKNPNQIGVTINTGESILPSLGSFETQFIQHHPELISTKFSIGNNIDETIYKYKMEKVSTFKLNNKDAIYSFTPTIEGPFVASVGIDGTINYPLYIASRADRSNWLIYRFDGKQYSLIPYLGTFGTMEYQYSGVDSTKFAKTMLNRVNPDVENGIVTMPTQKEIINSSSIDSVLPIGSSKASINNILDTVVNWTGDNTPNYISSNPREAIAEGIITEEQYKAMSTKDIQSMDNFIYSMGITARNMKEVFNKLGTKDITFNVGNLPVTGVTGYTSINGNSITIQVAPSSNWVQMQSRILHELTHVLFNEVLKPINFSKLTAGQKASIRKLELIRRVTLDKAKEDNITQYGSLNLQEFVAEALTSRKFRDYLNEINISEDKTLWQQLSEVLKNLLRRMGLFNRINEEGALRVTDELINNLMDNTEIVDDVQVQLSLPIAVEEDSDVSKLDKVLSKEDNFSVDSIISKVKDKFKHCL